MKDKFFEHVKLKLELLEKKIKSKIDKDESSDKYFVKENANEDLKEIYKMIEEIQDELKK